MTVILHFIYGGILDFPCKADPGYVSSHVIFNHRPRLFCFLPIYIQIEGNITKPINNMVTVPKIMIVALLIIFETLQKEKKRNRSVLFSS